MKLKIWRKIARNDLKQETSKHVYDFQHFQTIRFLGDSIFNGKFTMSDTDKKHGNLLENNL